jgi:thioredoxin:protein disulfide reductase
MLGGIFLPAHAEQQPLPADQVFQVSARQLNADTLAIHWKIKSGYYLYREKIQIHSNRPIKKIILPPGKLKQNKFLGKYQIYQKGVDVLLKFAQPLHATAAFTVKYQGCAVAGFCYPPVTKKFSLQFPNQADSNLKTVGLSDKNAIKQPKNNSGTVNEQGKAMELLAGHNLGLILLGFFGFGLLLSLTPCVLPLIPVLSAIILGQRQLTTLKAFTLSLTYVLAMAVTYALAGVFAGLAGSYLQAFLQNKWVILFVCLIFVLLAFSLFGFFDLQLPPSWHDKLTHLTNRQKGGSYLGVALMGCLSTLVISPCITAPLVGVLTYIGNTGNAFLGGFALFILGFGTGIPLLIIGTSAGKWLPKSGPWMNWVKIVLGIMMLVMAAWLLFRSIPIESRFFQWLHINRQVSSAPGNTLQAIKSTSDFDRVLLRASQEHKPVLLDFYANWCISCKEMEHTVLNAAEVRHLLSRFIVLRADVTANDATDKALERKFNIIAPPAFLFFLPDSQEQANLRIVGQVSKDTFIAHLHQALSDSNKASQKNNTNVPSF